MAEPLIRMEKISKFYGPVRALEDVSLTVNEREIVGLLGDNGAGKSTLIKILSGVLRASSGDIFVRGRKVDIRSTTDAIAQGIETIYQDSALVTQLSIAQQPVPRPRAGEGSKIPEPHGQGEDGGRRGRPAAGRSASPRTFRPRRRSARFRAASGRRSRSPAPCISTAT